MNEDLIFLLQQEFGLTNTETFEVLERSSEQGVVWSYPGCLDYPQLWMQIEPRPAIFCYQGEPVWNQLPLLSVVGSRTPMVEILQWMNREFSEYLRQTGWGVVSGGARGIDQWSHRLALDNRCPTVCIFPCGLLNPYPFGQEALWERILKQGGALVSTFGLDLPMRKQAFHIRNRWIAGLGHSCFVAEANRRSGSSLTAQLTIKLGREVCTLPVSSLATQGLANLDLICDGAPLIRQAADLITFSYRNQKTLAPSTLQGTEGSQKEDAVH